MFCERHGNQDIMAFRVVNDSVHGHYHLPDICWRIIDTQAFQRLRDIKQLGLVYKVFPGAVHSRFEHSLGVCYLARRLMTDLSYRHPEAAVSQKEILLVTIAGLCHDLGHCAFSHMFEQLADSFDDFRCHEHMSYAILVHLYGELEPHFHSANLSRVDIDIIGQIIFGSPDKAPKDFQWQDVYPSHPFIYEIVSNSDTGVDVDKFDYILRDCRHANVQCAFDPRRVFEFTRLHHGHIQYHAKIDEDIRHMWQSREELHRRVYRHKTVKKLEALVLQVLTLSRELPVGDTTLDGIYQSIPAYIMMTDHILTVIRFSTPSADVRKLLQAIDYRQLDSASIPSITSS